MNDEIKVIFIPKPLLSDLEKIAWLMFPLEAECIIAGKIEGDVFTATELILGDYYSIYDEVEDVKYYRETHDFEELIQNFEANIEAEESETLEQYKIEQLVRLREGALQIFEKYKECQRRRKFKECLFEPGSPDCEQCPVSSVLTTPAHGMGYDDLPDSPFLIWHSHPTSEYGDLVQLAIPSEYDSRRIVMWRLRALELTAIELPLVAELITSVSEQNQHCTNAFSPPQEQWINPPFERREITIIPVSN